MLDRRTLIAAGPALVASGAGAMAAAAEPGTGQRATFLLVHGTWLGGWIWADVADRLRAMGHRVFTPTLTGCGERHHLTGPDVGLETHIRDLAGVIDWEGLDQVILVAHSFSGVAATGAADRRRDRIRRMVFFDALIPAPGRMSAVARNADGSLPDWWHARARDFIDGYQMEFWKSYKVDMLVPPERTDLVALLRERITTHPAHGWTDELRLVHGGWQGLRPTCVRATAQRYSPSSERMWGPALGPGWELIDLPVTRMGMLTEPEIVTACFARFA